MYEASILMELSQIIFRTEMDKIQNQITFNLSCSSYNALLSFCSDEITPISSFILP